MPSQPAQPASVGRDSLELASLASSEASESSESSESAEEPSSSPSHKLSLDEQHPLAGRRPHRSFSISSAFDFGRSLFPLSQTAAAGGYYAPLGPVSLDRHGSPARAAAAAAAAGLAGSTAATTTTAAGIGPDGRSLERNKTLTYLNGLSLIVGLIIGSGIFSSPGQVNANAGSPGASLLVWLVAGLLAWTGAASYAELGAAIPLSGGAQVYLAKIFGEMVGFLFTWCAVLVLKPGSAAIIAIIFGEYVVGAAMGGANADAVAVQQQQQQQQQAVVAAAVSPWINKGVAVAGLLAVTVLNGVSTKLATRIGDVFMFFKFVALLGVAATGAVVAVTGLSSKGAASEDWKTQGWFDGTRTDASSWAVALYAGLWAFDGWDNTNYVTGEFKHPHRDLPRVIHTAMPLVILCYLLANVSYFLVLPHATIEATNTVAVQFGSKVFGRAGAVVLALVVSASCLGALNATTFTSSRLVYVAGREGYLPALFGSLGFGRSSSSSSSSSNRLRQRSWASRLFGRCTRSSNTTARLTPVNALVFNAALTTLYVVVGEFGSLVTFYGVAGYTFYFVTVLGLLVLRIREPHLDRPYRTWISTPIVFCCVSLFLLSRAVVAEPVQAVTVLCFILAGVPVYFWRIYLRDGKFDPASSWAAFWPPFCCASTNQWGV